MKTTTVAVAGLGAIGYGMATSLVRAGYDVKGFDINDAPLKRLQAAGGTIASSIPDLAANADFFICIVATAQQAWNVLFDQQFGAISLLPHGSTIILAITARPDFVSKFQEQTRKAGREDVSVLDCPVSGGEARANSGTLSLMFSGDEGVMSRSDPILRAMGSKLYPCPGGLGAASRIKFVHQIFVGVNIVAAVEMTALARAAGLEPRIVHEKVMKSEGASWLFDQRVSHMIDSALVPASSLSIITKDMTMISAYCREHNINLPAASIADQLLKFAAFRAWDMNDDTSLVNLYCCENDAERVSGAHITAEDISLLLLGIHTAASLDVLDFSRHLEIDESLLVNIVKEAAGANKAFELLIDSRGGRETEKSQQRLDHLRSEMATIVGRVLEGGFPLPLTSVALQVVSTAGKEYSASSTNETFGPS